MLQEAMFTPFSKVTKNSGYRPGYKRKKNEGERWFDPNAAELPDLADIVLDQSFGFNRVNKRRGVGACRYDAAQLIGRDAIERGFDRNAKTFCQFPSHAFDDCAAVHAYERDIAPKLTSRRWCMCLKTDFPILVFHGLVLESCADGTVPVVV